MAIVWDIDWEDFSNDGLRAFVGKLVLYISKAAYYEFYDTYLYEYGVEISVGESDYDLRIGETSEMSVQEIKDDLRLFLLCNRFLIENMVDHRSQDDFQ